MLFAAAGLLLLLGSPIHWGAKSMAFIVGVALVVGALISLSDGNDILGIFATNNWTKLVMGAGGAALILLSMMPRVGRRARHGAAWPSASARRERRPLRPRQRPRRARAGDHHRRHARRRPAGLTVDHRRRRATRPAAADEFRPPRSS